MAGVPAPDPDGPVGVARRDVLRAVVGNGGGDRRLVADQLGQQRGVVIAPDPHMPVLGGAHNPR